MRFKNIKILSAVAIFIYLLYFAFEYFFIPEDISLTAGEKYTINLDSPFEATVYTNTMQAMYINNKYVDKSENIKLSEDFDVSCHEGKADLKVKLFGVTLKNVEINAHKPQKLCAVGTTAGICVNTKGVLVLATGKVKDSNGNEYEPSSSVLLPGDIITKVNSKSVYSNADLQSAIGLCDSVNIDYLRDNKPYSVTIKTVRSKDDGLNKIGLWVRDSTQGIGTITYYNKENGRFGALGHPITDVDTGKLIEIDKGEVLQSKINEVQKGEKGTPGALLGSIDFEHGIGEIDKNNTEGIYGYLNKEIINQIPSQEYVIGYKSEVQKGDAYILANVDGESISKYKIRIDNINKLDSNNSKNFSITITDKNLIDKTGGIVQGMSGCPIIQNDKIIGAVTHVLVNNPQRGYGIFIENMIKN